MLLGIRPTIGRISRYGVIPITADHDTAGPMTRTVADAAILLGALEGASADPHDPATTTCTPPPGRDYTKFLRADALKGARIGIPRAFYYDRITVPGEASPRGGLNAEQAKAMTDAIAVLKQQGAIVVDPADVPSFIDRDPQKNFLAWDYCSGAEQAKGRDANCSVNFKYGMKRDFNLWLNSLGPSAPVKTLTELRQWNITHMKGGAVRYGQSRLDISDEMDLDADKARNEADVEKDKALSRDQGIDGVLKGTASQSSGMRLDAILTPGGAGAGAAHDPDAEGENDRALQEPGRLSQRNHCDAGRSVDRRAEIRQRAPRRLERQAVEDGQDRIEEHQRHGRRRRLHLDGRERRAERHLPDRHELEDDQPSADPARRRRLPRRRVRRRQAVDRGAAPARHPPRRRQNMGARIPHPLQRAARARHGLARRRDLDGDGNR